MKKVFQVTLISTSPTYTVTGDDNTSLETVWASQKSLFAPGTQILIRDTQNDTMKIFKKETRRHG